MKKYGWPYISPIGQLMTVAARGPFTECFWKSGIVHKNREKKSKLAPGWLEMLKFYTWRAKNYEYSWWSATRLQRHLADEGGLWLMGPAGNPTGKPMLNSPRGYSPLCIFLARNLILEPSWSRGFNMGCPSPLSFGCQGDFMAAITPLPSIALLVRERGEGWPLQGPIIMELFSENRF